MNHRSSISTIGRLLLTAVLALFINTSFAEGKHLLGTIVPETGLYTAIDKSFSVTLPLRGTREEVVDVVTDKLSTGGAVISIGTDRNSTSYRLEISFVLDRTLRNTSFRDASKQTFDFYRRIAQRAYPGQLIEVLQQPIELDGKPAALSISKQFADGRQGPRYHLFYLADYGNKLGFVWTDIPLAEENLDVEDAIINGTAPPVQKSLYMLRSLVFN